MAKQHRRTWQRHEERIARVVGGVRSGNTGAASADVATAWLAIECKSWARLPSRVVEALEQAERAAGSEQLPLAVLHAVGQRSGRDLVVMRWADFLEWFGDDRHNDVDASDN